MANPTRDYHAVTRATHERQVKAHRLFRHLLYIKVLSWLDYYRDQPTRQAFHLQRLQTYDKAFAAFANSKTTTRTYRHADLAQVEADLAQHYNLTRFVPKLPQSHGDKTPPQTETQPATP